MTTYVIDYSAGRPSGAAVAAAGYAGAMRYCSPTHAGRITTTEATSLLAAHRGVGLVHERGRPGAWAVMQGAPAGTADAGAAAAYARTVLPGWTRRPIYFAVDFDAQLADLGGPITAYLRAVGKVLGGAQLVGVYGSARTVEYCRAHGLAHWFWQTAAWSHGEIAAGIHLYQEIGTYVVDGVACDRSRVLAADWGQWPAPATPAPPPTRDEDDPMVIITAPNRPWLAYYPVSGTARLIGSGEQAPLQAAHAAAKDTVATHSVTTAEFDALLRYLDRGVRGAVPGLAAVAGQVAGLTTAVTGLAAGSGTDPKALAELVKTAAAAGAVSALHQALEAGAGATEATT